MTTRPSASTQRSPSWRTSRQASTPWASCWAAPGNGEQIAANKVKGVRAALAWNHSTATLAREHNDANVVAVGGRQHTRRGSNRTDRGVPGGAVQQRRTPRPPDRQDRCLRNHRRGHRVVPEGPFGPPAGAAVRRRFCRRSAGRQQSAGPVRCRRGPAGRPHADRLAAPTASTCSCILTTRLVLHVHLGLYGAWDFGGDATFRGASSIGAPRKVGEREVFDDGERRACATPARPHPVGAVRVRLVGAARLGGPARCHHLRRHHRGRSATPSWPGWDRIRCGTSPPDRERFRDGRAVTQDAHRGAADGPEGDRRRRERLPGRSALPPAARSAGCRAARCRGSAAELFWDDTAAVMADGVRDGRIITTPAAYWAEGAACRPATKRTTSTAPGQPCRVCAAPVALAELGGRKLYWCPGCQQD